jgi:cell division protein FtsI (penicillin-binding protein 3)
MSIKRDILFRINIVFMMLCSAGMFIVVQAFRIQFIEGAEWRKMSELSTKIDTIEGERGNMYSEDDRLIATSLPHFNIFMDMNVAPDSIFKAEVDSLSIYMAKQFGDKNALEYREQLVQERKNGNAYMRIAHNISFQELLDIKQFPILKRGRYKGGIIIEAKNKRITPFGLLAQRTIGYVREHSKSIGLEGSFDEFLRGSSAIRSYRKVAGGEWVPLFDEFNEDIENGKDVYTTIDINLQDVVETALLKNMRLHNAGKGCAIVMEVKTGKIKAIANLGKSAGDYAETFNYAIGERTEPGSTFKVATLAALLDEGYVTDSTKVNIEGGRKKYYDKTMKDDSYYPVDSLSVAKVMQISSNVGISKLAVEHYNKNPQNFIDKLRSMRLSEPTAIEIEGEPVPFIPQPGNGQWSGITLPWMAIGYEVALTPLQMLTFYNAIANDGKMMKPYLVNEIRYLKQPIHVFEPEVLDEQICKKSTAQTIRHILKGVLESGTAKNLYSEDFSVAGKTGTALIAKDSTGYKATYQASIAGFFPAENPVYSCIVVISSPTEGGYYGAEVAGPVFKEIIEKYYSTNTATHEPINLTAAENDTRRGMSKWSPKKAATEPTHKVPLPIAYNGNRYDIQHLYNTLKIPNTTLAEADWVAPQKTEKGASVALKRIPVVKNLVPNVQGMGLKDALYLLESNGLRVRFSGKGKVRQQVPSSGTRCKKGDVVVLDLD